MHCCHSVFLVRRHNVYFMWLSFTLVITGNYSCLVAKFHLSRSIGFHMVQSYIPTILIVVISWVSFWMDVDSVPGRTTLGVTTLLTVSSKSAGMKATKSNHQQRPQEALLLHKKASIAKTKKTFWLMICDHSIKIGLDALRGTLMTNKTEIEFQYRPRAYYLVFRPRDPRNQ